MGVLRVVFSNLANRKLSSLLTIVSVSVGVVLLIGILIISSALQQGAVAQGGGYDIIVGAKGSESQLVLSTIFHYDVPIGNICYEVYENLAQDERVTKAVPLALGDNYANHRIIGTDHTYFIDTDEDINTVLQEGHFYEKIGEVVVGANLVRDGILQIGDTFQGAHGITGDDDDHDHNLLYEVVGVLAPRHSADDHAIFTMIESVWEEHHIHATHTPYYVYREDGDDEDEPHHDEDENHHDEDGHHGEDEHHHHDEDEHHHDEDEHRHDDDDEHHHDEDGHHHHDDAPELTAVLITGKDIVALSSLKAEIEEDLHHPAQAAFVVVVLRQLLNILGDGATVAEFLAYISITIAAISILISLMSSMTERRKDVAVMRMLGASKAKILTIVILEAAVIAGIGVVIGTAGGHLLAHFVGIQLQSAAGLYVDAMQYWPGELATLATVLGLGLLSGIIPALSVYKTEPTKFIYN
ncbi:MAG: ABC transporter permease [Firmicutes bacterium]|nr:ABC transporter permease [Bacillota bacterium]